jgi:16S rRNA U516 pseudouridylate synthase RsuA-like enzyme
MTTEPITCAEAGRRKRRNRPEELRVRLGEAEAARIRRLAQEQGLTVSDFVRRWIDGLAQ